MDDQTDRLAVAIRALLKEQLERSPAVRSVAVELAQWILSEADRLDHCRSNAEFSILPKGSVGQTADTVAHPERNERAIVPLRIGGAVVHVEVKGSKQDLAALSARSHPKAPIAKNNGGDDPLREIDLSLVATRSRLKSESCRLFIERRGSEDDETRESDAISHMNALIAEAKAMQGCFLWVFWRYEEQPSNEQLCVIAKCYNALAEAAELCEVAVDNTGRLSKQEKEMAFQHFAEADSALRVALAWTWLSSGDRDQDDAHLWVRRETANRQVFVAQHMTLDDPADPYRIDELLSEIRTLTAIAADRMAQAKRIESLFNTARYHARQLPCTGQANAHDCNRINESLAELEHLGVSSADARCVALQATVRLDVFPDDEPPHHFLHTQEQASAKCDRSAVANHVRRWSDQVLEVRELLAGGSITIVGGEPRTDAAKRIRNAFAVEHVEWVQLSEHGTGKPMRAPIARAETRLVLVLIKLCGHLHAEEARRCARDADKSCVLLPTGYNPEQIAEQVLKQAANRLV